jgi:DNA adenine methylase
MRSRSTSSTVVDKSEALISEARPFLKWVGGKRQLLPELLTRLPDSYRTYFEPFIGGGALYFAHRPERACISDINHELINVYSVVANDVEALIEALSQHVHSEEYFYTMREMDRLEDYSYWTPLQRASRLLFLNKTCFNGLYRVNSQGYFNTPFGDYRNPTICDAENLRACSLALKKTKVGCYSYMDVGKLARKGDFVYFDPPYAPLNATSSFTGYVKDGFGSEDQVNLKNLCDKLTKKGVLWMLSNSTAPLILDLYEDYNMEKVRASRSINSKGDKRGKIHEVIVRNYD